MIELFFDFISPYSYLACMRARELGARVGHEVEPRPVLLAGILNALGTKGPAEVPARRTYMVKDLLRAAHRAGITIHLPPTHPFNPLVALRVAGLDLDRALRWRIVDALYAATWGGGHGIEGPERVAAVLQEAGLDGASLVALASLPEAKERLRRTTDEAIARGAFGVPTLFVGKGPRGQGVEGSGEEMFFGFDSFGEIEAFVRGEDPVQGELVKKWNELQASASRTAR
jgi:2-hydroxychromene-2-carboxylate isomerase